MEIKAKCVEHANRLLPLVPTGGDLKVGIKLLNEAKRSGIAAKLLNVESSETYIHINIYIYEENLNIIALHCRAICRLRKV